MANISAMDIRTFIKSRGVDHNEFAQRIEVSPQALYRYMRGDRIPHRDVMQRIIAATNGAVQANDFFATPTPAPSEQVAA